MEDYEPVDLSRFCNAGRSFIGQPEPPRCGELRLHGLPFLVGGPTPDAERCVLGFDGPESEAQTIPLNTKAYCIIFAHALLETRIYDGEPVGRVIADYVVRYADGEAVRLPIRERFEIAVVPTQWGQLPFLALPDQNDGLMPRFEGPWSDAGARQTEASGGWPRDYYLWAWTNPSPDRALESLRIEPCGRRFVLAAVTLGHRDEPPFPLGAKREVLITLPQASDAEREEQLTVDVDRGVATYPYTLPQQPVEQFLVDTHRGWGELFNIQASPAYVEISAIPSATVEVKQGEQTLASVRWGELEERGAVATPRARLEVVDRGRNWVNMSVLDDATGRPVPCRAHFRSPEGIPYQPHGHHNHVYSNLDSWHKDIGGDLRLGQISYAYIDGRCQGWLPRGDVVVDIARGFEYEPLRARVRIEPGQRELTLRLKRWTDMNSRRWFSGDSHVHFLGAQGAEREAQGEDLNVVNLLQSQWGHLFTNTEDWTGGPNISRDGKTIVYCSQENRQHILGHLTLWGLKQPIMPWCSDGPDEAELGGSLEATMSAWADAAHEQGGTVIIPHLPVPNGEPAALIATGRADAVEMLWQDSYVHNEYYRYLNCGYRLPLVGGTDKMSSEVAVGMYRTYASIPDEEFSYDSWCRAVRAGRTFLSGGPMIDLRVDGAQIGDTIDLPKGGSVEVEATAESIFPIHTLQIVERGRVVAETSEASGARRLHLRTTVPINGHSWLAARCGGPQFGGTLHHDRWQRGVFAHTSPIYIAVGEPWWLFDRSTADYMLTLVEGTLQHVRERARYYRPGTITHQHSEPDHQAYLERPLHEAAAAIHRRMHELGLQH